MDTYGVFLGPHSLDNRFFVGASLECRANHGAQQNSGSDQPPIQFEATPLYAANNEPGPLPSSESGIALPDNPDPILEAQQSPPATVSSPAQPANAQDQSIQGKQTKRMLYIVPNFRAVSADSHLPRQPLKEKFKTAAEDSFDYSSFIFVGLQAGLGQIGRSYPEFGNGTAGYGRYYWHTLADGTDENLWVEFVIPSALHQDTRYYTLGHGGFPSASFTLSPASQSRAMTGGKKLSMHPRSSARVSAAGISNLYYPSLERTEIKSYQRWVTNVSIDGGIFIFKEFWPDINNKFFHQKD